MSACSRYYYTYHQLRYIRLSIQYTYSRICDIHKLYARAYPVFIHDSQALAGAHYIALREPFGVRLSRGTLYVNKHICYMCIQTVHIGRPTKTLYTNFCVDI